MIPVSDLHIEKKMRKTRGQVAEMAWNSVEYAKSRGLIVELSEKDASRADQGFLKEIFSLAFIAGPTGSLLRYSGLSDPGHLGSSPRLPGSRRFRSTATTILVLRSQTQSRP